MAGKVVRENGVALKKSEYGGSIKELVKEKHLHFLIGYFKPGESMRPHIHTVPEEIYYVLDGEGMMTLGKDRIAISKGMAIFIPPNVAHAPSNTGKKDLLIDFVHATPETGQYMKPV